VFTLNKYTIYINVSCKQQGTSLSVFTLCFQDVIERAIVDLHANRSVTEPGSYVHQMPYPCYMQDRSVNWTVFQVLYIKTDLLSKYRYVTIRG